MPRHQLVSIDQLVEGLTALRHDAITLDRVASYFADLRVTDASLGQHTVFRDDRYARSLIYRDDLFEVMCICWRPGQQTPVHSHNGQLGWMMVERGAVAVTNYRYLSCDSPGNQNVVGLDCLGGGGSVNLERTGQSLAEELGPIATVDKLHTIHSIACPADQKEAAVTVHVYSRPFESCVTYDLDTGRCARRTLFWDMAHGRPVAAPAAS